jgi:SHS2 domain-containing protein
MKTEKFETFATTADVGIRIQGRGYDGLFSSALHGLNLLYFGEIKKPEPINASHYPFEFHGDSCENVLVNFLAEIVYLLQTENRLTTGITIKEAGETFIKADLLTIACSLEPEMEIKSVTYHNLQVTDKNGIKSAEVVFDV